MSGDISERVLKAQLQHTLQRCCGEQNNAVAGRISRAIATVPVVGLAGSGRSCRRAVSAAFGLIFVYRGSSENVEIIWWRSAESQPFPQDGVQESE